MGQLQTHLPGLRNNAIRALSQPAQIRHRFRNRFLLDAFPQPYMFQGQEDEITDSLGLLAKVIALNEFKMENTFS